LLICMGSVVFHAAVTDAVGTIVRQVSEDPPANVENLLLLLFSSPAVNEVGAPESESLPSELPEGGITSIRETAARDF
jgi:hypothetical protein